MSDTKRYVTPEALLTKIEPEDVITLSIIQSEVIDVEAGWLE